MQHFTYHDLLPAILSDADREKHDIKCKTNSRYQPDLNPGIRNEFGAAVFRFGHSLVQVRARFHHRRNCYLFLSTKLNHGFSWALKRIATEFHHKLALSKLWWI